MRASRLIQLVLLLQRRGRTTAASAARELEVSVRTIYRDVEALSAAGIPVYAESGPGGGVSLVDGWETRLTGLTLDETTALGFAALPEAASQLGLGAVLGAAQAKVDAALPPELRSRAARVRERFLVDAPGWFEGTEEVPALPALSEALWDGRRVDLRYERGDGRVVRRTASPLGLVLKGGTWYLLAEAGRPPSTRTYRVGRVRSVGRRADRVVRPAGFDLAAAWAESSASFGRELFRIDVRIRMPADRLWQLGFAVTEPAAAAALASIGPVAGDGWCELTVPAESVEVAAAELLRLGDAVEVLHPTAVRARIAAVAARMAERHSPPRTG